jgi:alcohol dehydrogenase
MMADFESRDLGTALQNVAALVPFDFQLTTRIVFGPGSVDRLGELARELNGRRVLVVSDPGIVRAGHVEHGLRGLRAAGIETELFAGARENPTTVEVDLGVRAALDFKPDLLVGLGGGSSLDCAKGINFVLTNGGRMQDYWGIGKATRPMLPMIAVPTTAGTGSELQSFALITDPDTHVKMACGDKKATCRVAILDPELTLTQPAHVTALTGVDALSHALETYVTVSRNPASQLYSREAWRLLAANFPRVLAEPDDLAARAAMQWGASLAGLAIENSMLGAAHALANPLTAVFGIAHGQAVGVMLPHVIRFNGEECEAWYSELAAAGQGDWPAREGSQGLAEFIERMLESAGLASRLRDLDVAADALPRLADAALRQWTARHNPRALDTAALLELYRHAY